MSETGRRNLDPQSFDIDRAAHALADIITTGSADSVKSYEIIGTDTVKITLRSEALKYQALDIVTTLIRTMRMPATWSGSANGPVIWVQWTC